MKFVVRGRVHTRGADPAVRPRMSTRYAVLSRHNLGMIPQNMSQFGADGS